MSAFASAEAAAIIERAAALPRHDAIRQIVAEHEAAEPKLRTDITVALVEALFAARSNPIVRDIVAERGTSDDVECGWRWGMAPELDKRRDAIGVPVLFGRRSLRLWFPTVDLIGMANSYLAAALRSRLNDHFASDPEVVG